MESLCIQFIKLYLNQNGSRKVFRVGRKSILFNMTKYTKPLIAILLLSLVVAGCKKDEDKAVKSYFNLNGTVYNLSQGFLEDYGKSGNDGYNIDLTMLSSTFTIREKNGEIDSISGTGDLIYFEIFTSLPGKLNVMDYVYDGLESGDAGTFDVGEIMTGFNMMTQSGSTFYITGGKLSVTSVGSEYEITINCTTLDGKTVTGYYKGALKYYNYNNKKKSVLKFPS